MARREARILTHPGLAPLWRSIRREHAQQQLTAGLLVVGGLTLALFSLQGGWPAYWAAAGLAVFAVGSYWLFRLLGRQPLVYWREVLHERPEEIRWVYSQVTERAPFGLNLLRNGMLYLVDDQGEFNAFALRTRDLKLVTKTLNRVLPHAEFGYTEERERRYRGEVLPKTGRWWGD